MVNVYNKNFVHNITVKRIISDLLKLLTNFLQTLYNKQVMDGALSWTVDFFTLVTTE